MNRRDFIRCGMFAGLLASIPLETSLAQEKKGQFRHELSSDVVIIGGGLGGCAAALAVLRNGKHVVLTEETDWIGGQLTAQGVPPDEHGWIESFGATQFYRNFRTAIRNYYVRNYPLTPAARTRKNFNPGDGTVSPLCHEPRVALAVLYEMFQPYLSSGKLTLLIEHKVAGADVSGDQVNAVKVINQRNGTEIILTAPYFVDATELGDLLPLTGTEFRTGTESKNETKELHAAEKADPANQQAFTMVFAMDYDKNSSHVIDKPVEYEFWHDLVPNMIPAWSGRLLHLAYSTPRTLQPLTLEFHPDGISTGVLNLWNYRRIINQNNFVSGTYESDLTIVNWPQNDYFLGNLDGTEKEFQQHVTHAKQLSLALLYWLQTEVPRPDGGQGWSGLRLRYDVFGTDDGMAKYPYIRESRRIKALFTVLEEHVGCENRRLVTNKTENKSADFYDSVGVGCYGIDLHPSTGGNNYIDFEAFRYQIPLGALLPQRMTNLLPACKNIGTTHITNGCYRLHPTEWNIGEAVGLLAVFSLQKKVIPQTVREKIHLLTEFQQFIRAQGIETHWQD